MTMSLSAAVADGAKACLCKKCVDLIRNEFAGSTDSLPTDLELWRANRLSELLSAIHPGVPIEILCYAYDRQSPPPTEELVVGTNIHVILANHQYQVDGLPFSVRLAGWVEHRAANGYRLGVYDYIALPAFTNSSPIFPLATAWSRYGSWLDGDLTTFTAESTYSQGASGVHMWGMLKMAWDGPLSYDALMDEWCEIFGAAASSMRTMFDRWWGRNWPLFIAHGYEMGLACRDLAAADTAVSGDVVSRARVAAWMAYVVFLHYRYEWYELAIFDTPGSEEEADEAAEALLHFMWCTAHLTMADARFMHDVVLANTSLSDAFITKWTIPASPTDYDTWRAVNGIDDFTDAQIRSAFSTVLGLHPAPTPAQHTAGDLSDLTVVGTPTGSTPINYTTVAGNEGPPDGHEYIFYVSPSQAGDLRVQMSTSQQPTVCRLVLTNAETGDAVDSEDVNVALSRGGTFTNKDYDLTGLATGFYRLLVINDRPTPVFNHRIVARGNLALVRVGDYDRVGLSNGAALFERWFFLPKLSGGTTKFHVYSNPATNLKFYYDATGTPTQATVTETSPHVFEVTVPSGHDQEVWRMEGSTNVVRFLDVPAWMAPSVNRVIAPTNLVNE